MKIAITGHRPNKLGNDYDLRSPLIAKIREAILTYIIDQIHQDKSQMPIFISGMALGIDTLFAEIATYLKAELYAYIPFKGQHLAWPKPSQDKYIHLLEYASEIHICDTNVLCEYTVREHLNPAIGASEHSALDIYSEQPFTAYTPAKMQKRNEAMVNDCNILIAVWNGTKGGTYNCIEYAKHVGKVIYTINPKTFLTR